MSQTDNDADAGIDAKFHVGKFLLEAKADLIASLDSLPKKLSDILRKEWAYETLGPVQLRLRNSYPADSNGDAFVVDMGGPAVGRLWEIRRLVVGGVLFTSVVAGTAVVSIGASPQPGIPMSDLVDQAPTLPSIAFYSSGQLVLRNPEHLFIAVASPTASATYGFGGAGFDLPDVPRRGSVSE